MLWRLTKEGRTVECRARIVPVGNGLPEIRVLLTNSEDEFELLWSMTLADGRDVGKLSEEKRKEFSARGC